MYLHRLFLNMRCREVRRDIADPYEMHSTLCRAFAREDKKCPQKAFLLRLEPERTDNRMKAKVLVQSRELPDWNRIKPEIWFGEAPSEPIDIERKLRLSALSGGEYFRYRLRANPCVCKNGKRKPLNSSVEQEAWLTRQGPRNGFAVISAHCSEERMVLGKRRDGHIIQVFSVMYDGVLKVSAPAGFRDAVANGIGHGKVMGLGLFSVAPVK